MKKWTKAEALANHVKQWDWTAEEEGRHKGKYPPSREWDNSCACCEYYICHTGNHCGRKCIIKWANGTCLRGEYGQWRKAFYSEDYPEAQRLAKVIADLGRV